MGAMSGNTVQSRFRFRNDDGNETTATWKANEDTNINHGTSLLRVRIKFYEDTGTGKLVDSAISYSLNSGAYNFITTGSSVIRFVSSANVTDDEATTEQLTAEAQSFTAGTVNEDESSLGVLLGGQSTEMEYVLQLVDADVVAGDTIDIRMLTCSVFTQTPRITVVDSSTYTMTADVGNFTLTGQSANLLRAERLSIDTGIYSLTGQNVTLTFTPVGGLPGIGFSFGINPKKNSLCS